MTPRILLIPTAALSLAACSDLPTAPSTPLGKETSPAALVAFRAPPWEGCQEGTQPSGALYQICFPAQWNGDVVVWAHGYVAPHQPLAVPDDEIDGTPLSAIINGLGYGYAATSYRKNGLAADVAVPDLEELAGIVDAAAAPRFRLLVGASEGGLATALALERDAPPFAGGLTTCGPVGSFRGQVNHFGDFRAVFDYFFPGLLPGDATTVPQEVRDHFFGVYVPRIESALAGSPGKTAQLLSVTRAPTDPADPASVNQTVIGNLWYNVFAADDAVARLGGNPYDNRLRWYTGSANDWLLNFRIRRYGASATALAALQAFETSGALKRPTQSLHTTGDPIVPYWHQPLYQVKALAAGTGLTLISAPVTRYGHCALTQAEVLASFAVLVLRVSGQNLIASADAFAAPAARREFLDLAHEQGAAPVLVEPREWDVEAGRQRGRR